MQFHANELILSRSVVALSPFYRSHATGVIGKTVSKKNIYIYSTCIYMYSFFHNKLALPVQNLQGVFNSSMKAFINRHCRAHSCI